MIMMTAFHHNHGHHGKVLTTVTVMPIARWSPHVMLTTAWRHEEYYYSASWLSNISALLLDTLPVLHSYACHCTVLMAAAVAWYNTPASRLAAACAERCTAEPRRRPSCVGQRPGFGRCWLWRLVLDGCWGLKTAGNGALGLGGVTVVASDLERQARAPAPSLACLQSASSAPA